MCVWVCAHFKLLKAIVQCPFKSCGCVWGEVVGGQLDMQVITFIRLEIEWSPGVAHIPHEMFLGGSKNQFSFFFVSLLPLSTLLFTLFNVIGFGKKFFLQFVALLFLIKIPKNIHTHTHRHTKQTTVTEFFDNKGTYFMTVQLRFLSHGI